jgi:hypothetical protein
VKWSELKGREWKGNEWKGKGREGKGREGNLKWDEDQLHGMKERELRSGM